jgi:excisionase family DNA binding protein
MADISELLRQPTLTPEQVSRIFGLSRNGTYDAIKRGEIASVRLGKKILVPTAVIRKMLSIEAA